MFLKSNLLSSFFSFLLPSCSISLIFLLGVDVLAKLGLALLLTCLSGVRLAVFCSALFGLGWPMALFGTVGWLAAVLWLAGRASGRVASTVGGFGLIAGLLLVERVVGWLLLAGSASGRLGPSAGLLLVGRVVGWFLLAGFVGGLAWWSVDVGSITIGAEYGSGCKPKFGEIILLLLRCDPTGLATNLATAGSIVPDCIIFRLSAPVSWLACCRRWWSPCGSSGWSWGGWSSSFGLGSLSTSSPSPRCSC
jgi:hypothetical protein